MTGTLSTQVWVLARRSMLKTLRQPFQLFPIVFFPIILLAVNASGLRAATRLPGFPSHSYISFAIAVAFIQGGMFSLINTGTNLAEDIESGFFNRLALTPLRRVSLIGGLLVGVAALGALQSAVYILVGLLAGAHLEAGFGGAVVILVLGALTTLGFGALGFAGGLSALGSVPGFHFPAGYTAFQFVFVLCQASMFSGLFTGFSLALDFESGFARRLMLAAEDRRGIALGYALVALSRAAITLTVVTDRKSTRLN